MELSNKGVLKLSSDKFRIEDNQWIWNTDKYSLDELLDESDEEVLLARGKYLVEVIDRLPNKLHGEDLFSIPNNERLVLPFGPSSGKTSAIRQYIMINYHRYILYATKLIEDVDKFKFDLVSNLYYLNPNSYKDIVYKYTSKNKLSIEECQKARVLITTHQRLYTDPPNALYTVSIELDDIKLGVGLRQKIFIDEYIKQYKDINYHASYYNLFSSINSMAIPVNENGITIEQRNLSRTSIIRDLIYRDEGRLPLRIPMNPTSLERIHRLQSELFNPTKTTLKIMQDDKSVSNNLKFNRYNPTSVMTAIFFYNMLCEKYYQGASPKYDKNSRITHKYNLPDYLNNVLIFDGTGDILFRTSKLFKIYNIDNKFKRSLLLNNPFKIINNTSINRNISTKEELLKLSSDIKNKFIKSIVDILDNNNGKLLIYTWKSIKISDNLLNTQEFNLDNIAKLQIKSLIEDLPLYIIDNIDDKYFNRIRFITYQSGKERVTSDYIDCNMIYILGKFYLPPDAINDFNKATDSSSTYKDYTKSLIIQAIYRTRARLGKPVDIFFSNDYTENFIYELFSEFYNFNIINNYNEFLFNLVSSKMTYNSRNKKYYDFIINNRNKIISEDNLTIPDNERGDKFKRGLSNYLSNYNKLFKFIDTTDNSGKSVKSTFKIELLNNLAPPETAN